MVISFRNLLDFAEDVLRAYLQGIVDDFVRMGYIRGWVDDLGRVVEEVFSGDQVSQVLKDASGYVTKMVFLESGEVEVTEWAANGAFVEFTKFEQGAEDGLAKIDDMVENQWRKLDGTMKYWKWRPGHALGNFAMYTGTPASGIATSARRTILLVREASGELSQWIRMVSWQRAT